MKKFTVTTYEHGDIVVLAEARTVDDRTITFLDATGKAIAEFTSWSHWTCEEVQPLPHFGLLLAFYKEVIELTIKHAIENDQAVVYAGTLGTALEKVDKFWLEVRQANIVETKK